MPVSNDANAEKIKAVASGLSAQGGPPAVEWGCWSPWGCAGIGSVSLGVGGWGLGVGGRNREHCVNKQQGEGQPYANQPNAVAGRNGGRVREYAAYHPVSQQADGGYER